MDVGDLAELVQRYLAVPPTLVIGSGASIPLGLPSMGDLATEYRKLTPRRKAHADFSKWDDFNRLVSDKIGLEEALHRVDMPEHAVRSIVDTTWSAVNERCLHLHDSLNGHLTPLPLTKLLGHFTRVANPRLQVITTNYDRAIEYAADLASLTVNTGFRFSFLQRFATSEMIANSRAEVQLWKVHGSLDWFRSEDDRLMAAPLMRQIPANARPLIVTPGVSKYRETHLDPFRLIIGRADEALARAQAILCIGFGFNDDHIQPRLLERARSTPTPVVVAARELSSATHKYLLGGACQRYLAIEMSPSGSRVYSNAFTGSVEFPGVDFWSVPGFTSLLC